MSFVLEYFVAILGKEVCFEFRVIETGHFQINKHIITFGEFFSVVYNLDNLLVFHFSSYFLSLKYKVPLEVFGEASTNDKYLFVGQDFFYWFF